MGKINKYNVAVPTGSNYYMSGREEKILEMRKEIAELVRTNERIRDAYSRVAHALNASEEKFEAHIEYLMQLLKDDKARTDRFFGLNDGREFRKAVRDLVFEGLPAKEKDDAGEKDSKS